MSRRSSWVWIGVGAWSRLGWAQPWWYHVGFIGTVVAICWVFRFSQLGWLFVGVVLGLDYLWCCLRASRRQEPPEPAARPADRAA